MASVFKRVRDKKRQGASWYIAFTDETGKRRSIKGCPDKQATEAMARKLESEAELRRGASTPGPMPTPPTRPGPSWHTWPTSELP